MTKETELNILAGKRVYLSSPMGHVSAEWNWNKQRLIVINTLIEEFNLRVFDPYNDPKQANLSLLNQYKEKRDFDSLSEIAKEFVSQDLNAVNWADIVIAYVPKGIPSCGVPHEIINANLGKKLVLLVEGTDKAKINIWYYGFIKHRFIFDTWDDLFNYLTEINEDKHKDDPRLQFLYSYPVEWLS